MENKVDRRIPDLVISTGTTNADDSNDLLQVMRAVEAAEATIKQQVEDNLQLRSELEYKTLELHRRKHLLESSPMPPPGDQEEDDQQGFMTIQDESVIVKKVYENEREIMRLRRLLAEHATKEAKIRSEKHALETRIANMRLVFDQQQMDLVDAAHKAVVYRQEVIEENIRLAYALQDVQQERATFVSALLPILTDYSLQPQQGGGHDAQAIASNVRILFRHLQEKLVMTEARLKQFQYQVRLLESNSYHTSLSNTQQSSTSQFNWDRPEMGTEAPASHVTIPASPTPSVPNAQKMNWDQSSGAGTGNVEHSDHENRSNVTPDVPAKPTIARLDANRYRDDTLPGKQVMFREPEMHTRIDHDDNEEEYDDDAGGNSPYYPSSSYPRMLSPVHEDLFLEDDPLPAIEGLQISGEALPGHELQASGYSITGTTSCNFEWVRHLPDGSVNYIEGAKQPNYLVTADDVDTYLAIEVQPLDDRNRKGDLVRVFANDHNKISCNTEMQSEIRKILLNGQGSFPVLEFTGFLDIWEPATLVIKRNSYSIKRSSETSAVAAEKFSPNTFISIPYGSTSEFMISDSYISGDNADHLLKTDDASCSRDTLVLILRLFILRAVEKRSRKGKKRVLFFG